MINCTKHYILAVSTTFFGCLLYSSVNNSESFTSVLDKPGMSENYLAKYKDSEVNVTTINNNGVKTKCKLLNIENDAEIGDVVIIKPVRGKETIIIPIQEKSILIKWEKPVSYNESIKFFDSGQWESGINLLRPHIYPLVKFLKLARSDFYTPVQIYLNALLELKQWNESLLILTAIPHEKILDGYVDLSLKILEGFLSLGRINQAMYLVQHISGTKNNSLKMKFANQLREHEYFAEASSIYKNISKESNFSNAKECQLWFYLCKLKQEITPLIKNRILALNFTDQTQREYPLGLLLKGQIAISEEQYEKAILLLSKSIVYSNLQNSWFSELMHTTATVYEKLGKKNAAKNIHRQIILFFKNSVWETKSQNKLQKGDFEDLQAINDSKFFDFSSFTFNSVTS